MNNEDKPSYWDLLEPIWGKADIHKTPDIFLTQFKLLPQAVGDLYAAHWLVSEVVNGAFPQFFSNSTGVLAPEALIALKRIGLDDAAEITEACMTFFGEEYPRDRDTRANMIDWVWSENLSEDDEYNLDILLDLSGQFLDALGKDLQAFNLAADAYALRYLNSL
nr:DUF4375 domain-containing protein [uncultured Undibacterium sp.]